MTPNPTPPTPRPATANVTLRWTIARKLYLLVGLLLALFLGVVLYTLLTVRASNQAIARVTDSALPLLRAVMDLNEQKTTQNALVNELLTEGLTNSVESTEFKLLAERVDSLGKKVDDLTRSTSELMNKAIDAEAARDPKLERVGKDFEEMTRHHEEWDKLYAALQARLRTGRDAGIGTGVHELEAKGAEIEVHVLAIQNSLSDYTQDHMREVSNNLSGMVLFGTVFASIALLGGGLLGVVLVQRLIRPIDNLTGAARAIATGHLNVPEVLVQTTDETAVLTDAFNRMAAGLRNQIQDTKAIVETLSAATAQISASIQEQAASSKAEAATIQEITTTMQEIRQSGADMAGRASEVSRVSEASVTASDKGLRSVEEGSRSLESTREQVEEVAEHIVALSEKNQAVSQIIATVTEIAEQSHLLAINAAIEAVSAGEHGGRFTVVAGEMRNLANQAKDATVQVRNILGEVQKGINTSVMLAEEAVKRVEAAKGQAQVTRQTIGELQTVTQDSTQAFQQIIAGTHQQQIGVEQITQGMHDIRQAAQQTAAGISQLEQAMNNLVALARQLRQSIERYTL
jgi:methyl-accepting chemotaxis protein